MKEYIDNNIPEDFRDSVWDAFEADVKVSTSKKDIEVYRYYEGDSKPSSY